MAAVGARLHRTGSVYSRIKYLVKSGVLPYDDRPIWYDVYKAFPPIREPKYIQDPGPDELGLVNVEDNVRSIFYPEDWARATFNMHCQKNVPTKPVCLLTSSDGFFSPEPTASMKFVENFQQLQNEHPNLSKEEIFDKALKAMNISV